MVRCYEASAHGRYRLQITGMWNIIEATQVIAALTDDINGEIIANDDQYQ
jgi:hypothetical protein